MEITSYNDQKLSFFGFFSLFRYFSDLGCQNITKMNHLVREIKMKDVFFQISSFLFDLRCDFDKNVWFFQEIKGGTLYQNSRFSHNLNKNEDFKGRKWFVKKLKCHEILTWFGRDDFMDFSSCSWIFFNKIREKILFFRENIRKILLFEVIETFYFVGNGEKGHQNEYEIYEMKVCPCENDLIMGPNF